MDGVGLLLVQISVLFLLLPIYIALCFIIYKIYIYEHLITNTNEFKNINRLISSINAPKRDLSEITDLAILVAKTAGEKLFKLFLSNNVVASNKHGAVTKSNELNSVTEVTEVTEVTKTIEKLCSFVCGAVFDNESHF